MPLDEGRDGSRNPPAWLVRVVSASSEAAETDDAIFAKSIDRVQPVISNLESGGASWIDYNVTREQLETRVAGKVKRGAPALWEALRLRIEAWFTARPDI